MNVHNQLMACWNVQVNLSRNRSSELLASLSILVPALVKKASNLWKAMFQSSSSYLILAILQILQLSCRADAGTINDPPRNLTVTLGETAIFSCNATGSRTLWYINNTLYWSHHLASRNGFNFTDVSLDTAEEDIKLHIMTVRFTATKPYNGTMINCGVYIDRVQLSSRVMITIRGGPATPEVSLTSVSSSELVLQWPHPFSWPDAPVTGYDVRVNPSVNGRSSWALTNNSLRMVVGGGVRPSLCQRHQFTVVASNALGNSTPGITYGGFSAAPTVPASISISDITFSSKLNAIFSIQLMLPTVCSYQEVEYTVSLLGKNRNTSMLAEGRVLNSSHLVRINVKEETQLVRNNIYELVVTMALPGLEESYQPQALRTKIDTTTQEDAKTDKQSTFSLPTTAALSVGTFGGLSMDLLVLICSVGGALVMCMLILIIIILLIYQHKKRASARTFRTSGTKSPTTPPMVSNPIYEGQPLYETIDPQFRLPMPLPPVNTSLGGTACPSPLESPYKNAVGPYSNCPQLMSFTTTLEEGYTIMSSVRDNESKNTESQSSGSEPESSDMARYVPDPSLQYASEC